MLKNYSYTPSEFFYDNRFNDYNTNNYILTYNQQLENDFKCPNKIVINQTQLFVLPYKPDSIDIKLTDVIGVFDAMQDEIGVFGSHRFLDTRLGIILQETLGREGLYKLAPLGGVILDRYHQPIEYILRGLYLCYK